MQFPRGLDFSWLDFEIAFDDLGPGVNWNTYTTCSYTDTFLEKLSGYAPVAVVSYDKLREKLREKSCLT